MARAILTLELDGGSSMEFVETSAVAIYGGADGVLLAQIAFEKAARACGMSITRPEPPAEPEATPPPAADDNTRET